MATKIRPIVFKISTQPVLLDSKATASYAPYAAMYTPNFTTDKEYICYKMTSVVNTVDNYAQIMCTPRSESPLPGPDVGLCYNAVYYTGYQGMVYVNGYHREWNDYGYPAMVAGPDGTWSSSYRGYISSTIGLETLNPITCKFVLHPSDRKAYLYVEDKLVAMCEDWGTDWNPLTCSLYNGGGNADGNVPGEQFSIQVYGCDSLEDAVAC